mmetsp:Transcript_72627/g.228801  ORF Transcript_72627/g.228801 Transcript_72627/m.228801 type:complete len:325 (+) Transcript_72627:146-1120(+)
MQGYMVTGSKATPRVGGTPVGFRSPAARPVVILPRRAAALVPGRRPLLGSGELERLPPCRAGPDRDRVNRLLHHDVRPRHISSGSKKGVESFGGLPSRQPDALLLESVEYPHRAGGNTLIKRHPAYGGGARPLTAFFSSVVICMPYLVVVLYALFRRGGPGSKTPVMNRLGKQLEYRGWSLSGAGEVISGSGEIGAIDVLERQFRANTFGEARAFLEEVRDLIGERGIKGLKPRLRHPKPCEYQITWGTLAVLAERVTRAPAPGGGNSFEPVKSQTYVLVRVQGTPLDDRDYELARDIETLIIQFRRRKREGFYDDLDDELPSF